MGVLQTVHNEMTVASCTVLMYTLPEIELILMSRISTPVRVTFSPLQSLQDVLLAVMKKHLCTAYEELQ